MQQTCGWLPAWQSAPAPRPSAHTVAVHLLQTDRRPDETHTLRRAKHHGRTGWVASGTGCTSTAPSTLHPPAFKHSTAILSVHPVMVRRVPTCEPQSMWRPAVSITSVIGYRTCLLLLAPVKPVHQHSGRPTGHLLLAGYRGRQQYTFYKCESVCSMTDVASGPRLSVPLWPVSLASHALVLLTLLMLLVSRSLNRAINIMSQSTRLRLHRHQRGRCWCRLHAVLLLLFSLGGAHLLWKRCWDLVTKLFNFQENLMEVIIMPKPCNRQTDSILTFGVI